ncbi:MAG: response regulator, partial [bacterium]|nr:response regulator [bacterium]
TGIGVPPDQQKLILNSFQQQEGQEYKKYGGTGLGLAITKRLVELMKGELTVQSPAPFESTLTPETETQPGLATTETDPGSIFYVKFKRVRVLSSAAESETTDDALPVPVIFEKATLLVTDDVRLNRELLKGFLEAYDISVIEAATGREAVELAKQLRPNLIVMEVKIPDMKRYEAIKIIKSDKYVGDIPIIILSASAMKEEEEKIKTLGCEGYLRKPVGKHEFINQLKRFLPYTTAKSVDGHGEKSTREKKASPSGPLPPEITEKIPEILDLLEDEFINRWKSVNNCLIIDEQESFANDLLELGQKYHLDVLVLWAQELNRFVSSFDIEGITKKVNSFPALIKDISKLIKKK